MATCEICAKIDLLDLCCQLRDRKDGIDLGPLESIIDRATQCSLCKIVVSSLELPPLFYHTDIRKILSSLRMYGGSTTCWLYNYPFSRGGPDEPSANETYRIAVSTQFPDKTASDNRFARRTHAGDIQLMADSAAALGLASLFRGRKMDEQCVNMPLAAEWLRECEHKHGPMCREQGDGSKEIVIPDEPDQLTVINVEKACLETLPEDARYVVLSYCWPKEPGLVNTKASVESLHKIGAFLTSTGISSTIRDAIGCTKALGETFLWVDALCITQDDFEGKRKQIDQMDRIYSCAVVTIVAAPDKHDTNEGLPGFRSRSRLGGQTVCNIDGVQLAVAKPCLEDILASTRWDTRGWTFQESVLSRRLLYFTSHGAYFQCSCGIRSEDTIGESHAPTVVIHHSTTLWNPKNPLTVDPDSDRGDLILRRSRYDDEGEALRTYNYLSFSYLLRDLSFPSDILNAFRGLMSVWEHSMDSAFRHGLPTRWFDHALLWQEFSPAQGRRRSYEECFPSWSWSGWHGSSEPSFWLNYGQLKALIDWFYVRPGRSVIPIHPKTIRDETIASGMGEAWGLDGTLSSTIVSELENLTTRSVEQVERPFLVTSTGMATFFLDGSTQETELDDYWQDHSYFKILDRNSHFVGLILLDTGLVEAQKGETKPFQFILLSRAEKSRVEDSPLFDEDLYQTQPWCLLNVMLVKSFGDLWERVAVGTIHMHAWQAAKPLSTVVKLG